MDPMTESWYLESPSDHSAHRGTMARGRVHTACGIAFAPVRLDGAAARPRLTLEPAQLCSECVRATP